MGNSHAKDAKAKKNKEKQQRDSDDEEDEKEQVEAQAFVELEIWHELGKGSTSTFTMQADVMMTLEDFKKDLQQSLRTSRNIAVYRDNANHPLGPASLSLSALQFENGTMLLVKEIDD